MKCQRYNGCDTHEYNADASSTAVHINNDTQVLLRYGSLNLTGDYIKDRVCLDTEDNVCVNNFTFFEIVTAEGL